MTPQLSVDAAQTFVDAFHVRGVLLWREGEALRYKAPPGVLTPPVLAKLRKAKEKILPLLPSSPERDPMKETPPHEASVLHGGAPSTEEPLRGLTGTYGDFQTPGLTRLGITSNKAPISEHRSFPEKRVEETSHPQAKPQSSHNPGERLPISLFSDHPGPLTEPPDVGREPTESGAAWFRAWAEREAAGLVAAGLVPELDPAFVAELEGLALTEIEKRQRLVADQARRGRAAIGEVVVLSEGASEGSILHPSKLSGPCPPDGATKLRPGGVSE